MPATRTAAQQAASRANGARSHGPTTAPRAPAATEPKPTPQESRTPEPAPPLNRHQRRALAALQRRRAA